MPTDGNNPPQPERVPPTHAEASRRVDASREKMGKLLKEMDQEVADADQRQEDKKSE